MKKLLIILMVVAMASFLFVGCFKVNNPPIITTLALPNATVGTAYTATVEATDADEDALTFSVSGPTGMVISEAGVISGWTPAEAGTEAVTVAVTDGKDLVSADFIITVSVVEPEPEPEFQLVGITVDPKKMSLYEGETEEIDSVTATYEFRGYDVGIDFGDCLFLTSDSMVATVEYDDVEDTVTVKTVKAGTATIIVSYKGKTDTVEVTVSPVLLTSIIVRPDDDISLDVGNLNETLTSITACYNDGSTDGIDLDDEGCEYKSSDPDVATVDEEGVITIGTKDGEALITVSYTEEGITEKDTVFVTVNLTTINIFTIPGIIAPVGGASPDKTPIAETQYTGTITWDPDVTFVQGNDYTATIILTATPGYTLIGVEHDEFDVVGAHTVSNDAGSGEVIAVFTAT